MKNIYRLLFILVYALLPWLHAEAACPVTVTAGGPLVFCTGDSVLLTASPGAGYLYQWKRNNIAVTGATSQTFYAKTTANYSVTVTVVSPACTTTSNTILVTAESPLTVTITNSGSSMCGASTDILEAPYGSTYFYQWYEDNFILPNSNNYQLNTGHSGNYTVAVTNLCGTYTSPTFVLFDPGLAYGQITNGNSTSFCAGGSCSLYLSGGGVASYQWYRNGVAIPGATGYSYTATMAGDYVLRLTEYCPWTSSYFDYYSNIITTTLLPGTFPTATISAGGTTTFCAGNNVTLNADTGTGWSYNWRKDGNYITGATSSSYLATTSGNYSVVVSNGCGTVLSTTIAVLVIPQSVSITLVGPATICNGATATMNAGSAGPGGTYQWKLNGSDIAGATGTSYAASVQGSYTCAITNACGTFTSNAINIIISGTCSTGLKFDGSNDYAKVPHHASTDFGTGNFTFEAWVNLDVTQTASYPTLFSNRVTSNSGYWVYFSNGRLIVIINGTYAYGGPDLRDNSCHHIAVSRSSPTTTRLYVDGSLVATLATSANVNTTNFLYIGNDYYYSGTNYAALKGSIMEVRLWNTERTQTDIQNNRNVTLSGTEPGLVGYYMLNDGTGQVINDYSPTNNDGQLGSTAAGDVNDPVFAGACALSACTLPTASISAVGPVSICPGGSVTLNANTGAGLTYQWKKNGENIFGATSPSYVANTSGSFSCQVMNACGSAVSNSIAVTVFVPQPITISSGNPTILCSGGSTLLSTDTNVNYTYAWYKNNMAIPGMTLPDYLVTETGNYDVRILDSNGCAVKSSVMQVFIGPTTASLSSSPSTATLCSGTAVTLTASPNLSGTSYQWYKNGIPVPGATGSNYTFNALSASTYKVEVTNACGTAMSADYAPTVLPPLPTAVSASSPTGFCAPDSVELNATNAPGLTWQWYLNTISNPILNAVQASYTADSTGTYFARITNTITGCSANSDSTRVSSNGIVATVTPSVAGRACDSMVLSANGGPGFTWQWRMNGTDITGATSQSYTALSLGTYNVDVVITGNCGSNVSNTVKVGVDSSLIPHEWTLIFIHLTCSGVCGGKSVTMCEGQAAGIGFNRFFPFGPIVTPTWYVNSDTLLNPHTYLSGTNYNNWVLEDLTIPGIYYCDISNGCGTTRSDTNTLSVYPATTANITAMGPTTFCPGGSVLLHATTGTGWTYQWKNNGFNIAGATDSTYIATQAGTYTCFITNTLSCGKLSNFVNVFVGPDIPVISAGGSTAICTGDTLTLSVPSEAGSTYQWLLNGIDIPGAVSASYAAASVGSYTCTVSNSCGISTSNPMIVTQEMPVVATISAAGGTSFCLGGSVMLNAVAGTGFIHQWKLNGGNITGATSPAYLATATGNYSCVITNSCNSDTSNSISVTVTGAPPATITAVGSTTFCSGGSVTLNANTGTGLTYQWKLNGGNISGATSSSYSATTAGNYTCTVTNTCGNTTSGPLTVTVNTLPTATITAGGSTTICSGSFVILNANTGTGLSYQWKRNGSDISGATSSAYSAGTAGSYTCLVTNACGSTASGTIVVTVVSPVATITAIGSTTFCTGGLVTLNANTGAGITWQWRLNGIAISGATASSYVATASGNYTCLVTNACGPIASNTIAVTVNAPPSATITAGGSTTICSGGSVTLSANTGAGLSYQWNLNGGIIASATASSYVAAAAGNYTCVVTNTCGSTSSNAIAVTVNTVPAATITADGPTTFCPGGSVTLNANTGTGFSWQWLLNGSNIPGATSSSYLAGAAGNYSCTVTNACGNTTSNIIGVSVSATPPAAVISAGGSTSICTGGSVTLNANTGTGLTYQWKLNGSDINGATASSYVATAVGNYTCVITNTCGSTTSNTITVTVNGPPPATITAGGSTTFCIGGSVTLNANTGTGLTYQWKLNGGNISGATSSSYIASVAGNFTCVVTNNCGGTTSNSIAVTIDPLPTASITAGGNTTICSGGSVILNANTGTGLTYQWKLNGGNIAGATSTFFSATAAGNYTCAVTNSCGSTTSNTILVTVNSAPTATITAGGSTTFCSGGSVTLNANTGAGLSYQWKLNGGNIGGATSSSYNATATGTYTCQVSNACGSPVSNSISVTVLSIPSSPGVIDGLASGICENTTDYTIAAVAQASSYTWTVPAGVTINSGQGTTSLNVTYPPSFSSGSITVNASNTCGTSGTTNLSLTSVLAPAGTISGLPLVCEHQSYIYAIAPVPGATNYTWTVPSKARILQGQGTNQIQVKMFKYGGNITVTASNNCMTSTISVLPVAITTLNCGPVRRNSGMLDAEVFPNPSSTYFSMKVYSDDDSPCVFILRDITGRIIERRESVTPGRQIEFGLQMANGIYLAEIQQGEERKVVRVVKSE